jgi:hypothetical protein
MGSIQPPKSAGAPTFVKLNLATKSLKLSIYETIDTITLFIGGHNVYCIEAMLYKKDSIFVKRLNYPAHVGLLTQVYYNINCSLEKNFQKGVDTMRILHVLCAYIRKHYPYVTILSFTDASYKTCDNNIDVELAEMTFLRTGKTWYEKNYSAYLEESYIPQYNEMLHKLDIAKKTMTWNDFSQFIAGECSMYNKEMEELYNSAIVWQDFFGPLSTKIGISEFCIFVAPWLHKFFMAITNASFASFKYRMPLDKIPGIEYSESQYVRGGRRFTQKRMKRMKNYQ